jgi:dolichol kinase
MLIVDALSSLVGEYYEAKVPVINAKKKSK